MNSKLLPNAFATALLWVAGITFALGQGPLDPPGPPAPTQKSLQQIWDKLVSMQADLATLQTNDTGFGQSLEDLAAQVTSVADRVDASALASDSRGAMLSELAAALGVDLPWHPQRIVDEALAGRESSLAYDRQGRPAISHIRSDSDPFEAIGDLFLIEFDGDDWFTSLVDTDAGYASSLKFDSDGDPAIAYFKNAKLRLAIRKGGVWQLATIDPLVHEEGAPSLAFDPDGNAGISYVTGSDELKLASQNGTAWELEVVAQEANGALRSTGFISSRGLRTSLAFDADGLPSIAYATLRGESPVDNFPTEREIKFAHFNGVVWGAEVVDMDPDESAASLALSPEGTAHIAYSAGDKVVIAKRGAFGGWAKTVAAASHPANERFPIAFTPRGNPAVAYHDEQVDTIVYVVLEDGVWDYQTARGPGLFAYELSLAIAPDGQPGIAYTVAEDGQGNGGGLLYTHRGVNR